MKKSFFIQNIARKFSIFLLGMVFLLGAFSFSGGSSVYAQSGDVGANIENKTGVGSTIGTEVTGFFKTDITSDSGDENRAPGAVVDLVNQIVKISMYVAVIALIILFIFVAFTMITSQGNPEKLNEAKEIATNAITGFILIAMASTILWILASVANIKDLLPVSQF